MRQWLGGDGAARGPLAPGILLATQHSALRTISCRAIRGPYDQSSALAVQRRTDTPDPAGEQAAAYHHSAQSGLIQSRLTAPLDVDYTCISLGMFTRESRHFQCEPLEKRPKKQNLHDSFMIPFEPTHKKSGSRDRDLVTYEDDGTDQIKVQ